jgi:hypothetical protein
MIYPKDSFYTNFAGAYQSKDVEITKDLIFHELGWLIAKKKKEVLAMLKEIGMKVSKRPTDAEIVKLIIDNKDNRRLHIGIAYLISEKNKESESDFLGNFGSWVGGVFKKKDKTGSTTTASTTDDASSGTPATSMVQSLLSNDEATSGGNVTVGSDPVSAIAGAIGSIFSFATSFKDADTQKNVEKSKLMQSVMAYKTAQLGSGSGSSNNTALYVIGGILVLGAILTGVYFYSKSNSSIPQPKA